MAAQNSVPCILYLKDYLQPAFLICAAVLAIAASTMSIAVKSFDVYLKKEPLPLKKSLALLNEKALHGYRVVRKEKIKNKEMLKNLGTEDYIRWVLEDNNAPKASPVGRCMLFITYHELPDRVPHVPEECYTGGGYQKLASDSVTFNCRPTIDNTIDNSQLSDSQLSVPGKYLVFGSTNSNLWQRREKFPVLYFFKVNGDYANSREQARVALNKNLFRKASYFSKVELVFNQKLAVPTKEEAVQAAQKLLAVLLPVLEREHWPDWE